jgi:hypothetical protein
MNAHHVEATFVEDGTLVLEDLPFHAGDSVEVIILIRSSKLTSGNRYPYTRYADNLRRPNRACSAWRLGSVVRFYADKRMSDPSAIVECDHHGKSYATFVCQHLAHGVSRGFYCSDDDDDLQPDAWCMKCNDLLMANGWEWNEEIEETAGVTLLCAHCYDTAKENNRIFRKGIEEQGWELCIVAERMNYFPDINPPSLEELLNLNIGDTVKLIFEILGEDGRW